MSTDLWINVVLFHCHQSAPSAPNTSEDDWTMLSGGVIAERSHDVDGSDVSCPGQCTLACLWCGTFNDCRLFGICHPVDTFCG